MRITSLAVILLALALLACGKQQVQKQPVGGGATTGIIINAQQIESDTLRAVGPDKWRIVDSGGELLFTNEDVKQPSKGVVYHFRRREAEGAKFWIGTNPAEVRATVQITGEGDDRETIFTLDDTEAARLRSIPDWRNMMVNANLVLLLGTEGQ